MFPHLLETWLERLQYRLMNPIDWRLNSERCILEQCSADAAVRCCRGVPAGRGITLPFQAR